MKRRIGLALAICCLTITLFGCGGASDSTGDTQDARSIIESEARGTVSVYYGTKYDIMNCIVGVTRTREIGENEYELFGKATIIDNYGDKWEATFDGKCTINGSTGRMHDMNYSEPRRQ